MFLLFSIIMSPFLNSGAGRRLLFACSVMRAWVYLSSSLKKLRRSSIFSINMSTAVTSLLALYVESLSHGVGDLISLLGIYSLVARNNAISEDAFLSKLVSNSAINKRFI